MAIQPLQEPGKNFNVTPVEPPGEPHFQEVTALPASFVVTAVVPINGASVTVLPSMLVLSPKPVAVTVTRPTEFVVMVETYLLPEPAVVCSQPHPFAAI